MSALNTWLCENCCGLGETIGVINGDLVEPSDERPCTGVISFLDKDLGGAVTNAATYRGAPHDNKPSDVLAVPDLAIEIP